MRSQRRSARRRNGRASAVWTCRRGPRRSNRRRPTSVKAPSISTPSTRVDGKKWPKARAVVPAALPRIATEPRRAAAMFLEASVTHMMTGDMPALISTAERAASLATSADPAIELLSTVVVGEALLALGDVERGDAMLTACEPYLLEGDPLALVEVIGMAGHASIWIERWDRARRILDHLIDTARRASAVSALIYPLAARSHLDFRVGRWAVARAEAAESVELAEDTGQLPLLAHSLGALARVEAGMGLEDEA